MRNLALHAEHTSRIVGGGGAHVTQAALDPDGGGAYVIAERLRDAETEMEIWLVDKEDKEPTLCAMHTTTGAPAPDIFSTNQLANARVIPEQSALVLITRSGDIVTWSTQDAVGEAEVVGTVEDGIHAAAWSPDDALLVLITGANKLILMTPTFDVLSETPLHTTEFGADAPVNVGWGSKSTQFHGSAGKAAAASAAPSTAVAGRSPDDDGLPRVSWRADGAFFCVSSLSPSPASDTARRVLRVYDRAAALHATSESTAGLEHAVAWRPAAGGAGQLLAGTQRFGARAGLAPGREGRHDVVFFERNGLRHGEFALRPAKSASIPGAEAEAGRVWGYRVRDLAWSADGGVLAVWIERDEGDAVQLWITGNYHWYLKHEVLAPPSAGAVGPGRFTSVVWHPEDPLALLLTTPDALIQRTYALETWASPTQQPHDSGSVAVVDGGRMLLTPFRTQTVPPPMSAHQLSVTPLDAAHTGPGVPVHACFASEQDVLAVLFEHGAFAVWDLRTRLGPGPGKAVDPLLLWNARAEADSETRWRQILVLPRTAPDAVDDSESTTAPECVPWPLALLGHRAGVDVVALRGLTAAEERTIELPEHNGRLIPGGKPGEVWWQASSGRILDVMRLEEDQVPTVALPEYCADARAFSVPGLDAALFVGLAKTGRFHLATSGETRLLAPNASSFAIAAGFLVYTTHAHLAHFAPLTDLPGVLGAQTSLPEWETRRVERGARLVAAVPSTSTLVLQMPRGNLENIAPRPLVLAVVRQDISAGAWKKAFVACRRHRVDLSVLVGEGAGNADKFVEAVPAFVDQIDDVDHFNLFLTGIARSPLPPATVTLVCDAVRTELEKRDLRRFANAVLTAHVSRPTADLEAALRVVLRLRETDQAAAEDALKYAVFLVPADTLFDAALGMYDFSLVLLVAQHAQKDPREYLPFLRELRALPAHEQRFRIDDHLRRPARALEHLRAACAEPTHVTTGSENPSVTSSGKHAPDTFERAMRYAAQHRLLPLALQLWRDSERREDVMAAYAEELFERREFRQAALVLVSARRSAQALVAYERALDWRAAHALAISNEVPKDERNAMGYRMAEELSSKKRHTEAADALLALCGDVRAAAIAYVEGGMVSEARRVVLTHAREHSAVPQENSQEDEDLLQSVILPGMLELAAQYTEDLDEMRVQIDKQRARIAQLRVKKAAEPEMFYGEDDPALHDVDVMTDMSRPDTAFTRYTAAPSGTSRSSARRTSRSKRKTERNAGKKGTVEEEEYLLQSISKLVLRFGIAAMNVDAIVPHLLEFTDLHRDAARTLLADTNSLRDDLIASVEEAWARPAQAQVEPLDSLALRPARMEPVDKVARPADPHPSEWRDEVLSAACPV